MTEDLANRSLVVRIKKRPEHYSWHQWPDGGVTGDLLEHVAVHRSRYIGAVYAFGKQLGATLDFVQNDEFSRVTAEIKFRVLKFCQVRGTLQIEVMGGLRCLKFSGECGFSDLPRPEQCDHWHPV
jgi:hypothetical protein